MSGAALKLLEKTMRYDDVQHSAEAAQGEQTRGKQYLAYLTNSRRNSEERVSPFGTAQKLCGTPPSARNIRLPQRDSCAHASAPDRAP